MASSGVGARALVFAPLTSGDLDTLRATMASLPPYSDFDATSLWSWSVEGTTEIAFPPGGAVIRTLDYVTGETSIWAAASSRADEVLALAWEVAVRDLDDPAISLVPEHTVALLEQPDRFAFERNRDEDDYIIDVETGHDPSSWKKKRRKALREFEAFASSGHSVTGLSLGEAVSRYDLLAMFDRWQDSTSRDDAEVEIERAAIARLVEAPWLSAVEVLVLETPRDGLIGFSVVEAVRENVGNVHFAKGDRRAPGVFARLTLAERLWAKKAGLATINIEQDLGLPGLRASKLAEQPSAFLRKFTVRLAQESRDAG